MVVEVAPVLHGNIQPLESPPERAGKEKERDESPQAAFERRGATDCDIEPVEGEDEAQP